MKFQTIVRRRWRSRIVWPNDAGLEQGPMQLVLQEETYSMLNAFADGVERSVNAALDEKDDPL